ncbi:hypothetical protein MKX03_007745 [Papaver bracteatum]|nr:hypothetical protein MKX03_007745 [Papaver bracteatum]
MVQIVEIDDHTSVTVHEEAVPRRRIRSTRIESAKQKVDSEEQDNVYSTEDWQDSLDDIGKGGLGLGAIALIGLTVTSTLQRSIDGRDECNTGPEAMRDILEMGGVGFCSLTLSWSVAMATKMIARKYKNKKKEVLKRRIFKFGVLISAIAVAVGLICLGIYFSDFFGVLHDQSALVMGSFI